ncbi:hypothetical protein ACJMK2_034017, partial [Sinanodonta woodiana]
CISNCNSKLMNADLQLQMDVTGNDTMKNLTDQNATFKWDIKIWSFSSNTYVPASGIVTQTGMQSQGLNIPKGSFSFGSKYLITAEISVGNRRGSFVRQWTSNLPPYNGTCTIEKYNVFATIDLLPFSCIGWLDDGDNEERSPLADVNPKLTYQVIQTVDGVEKLLLNTLNSMGRMILSLGDSGRNYTTKVTIRVVDITGDYAEQQFEVQSRPFEAFTLLMTSSNTSSGQNSDSETAAAIDQFTTKFSDILTSFPVGSNPDDVLSLVISGASQMSIVKVEDSTPFEAATSAEDAIKSAFSDTIPAATSKAQEFTSTLVNAVIGSALPQDSAPIESSRISQVANTLSVIINDRNKVSNKTKEVILDALDRISVGISNKSQDNEDSQTAVNSTFNLIATASGAILPVEKRTIQEPNFDDLRLQNDVLDELSGKQPDENSSRSPDEEAFFKYLQQLKEAYKLNQESSKLERLQLTVKSVADSVKNNQPLALGITKSYGGSDFQQNISVHAASEIQGKSLQSVTSSVAIDKLDVPLTGNMKISLSSMSPGKSVYKFDKDGESMFLSSDTCTFSFGTNFTGQITSKQTVKTPELTYYNRSVNSDDASGFSYHKFFIRSSKDYACVIVKPEDNRTYQYQVYIKKKKNPTLVDYDVRIVTNEANAWGACVEPGQLDDHEGLTYLGLRPDILPNNEYIAVNRYKREAANITTADNNITHIDPVAPLSSRYGLGTMTLSCMIWLEQEQRWIRNGCDMTWRPDENAIYCKCKARGTELTFGNSFYVAPNAIDFSAVFLKFDALSQAAVMSTLILIFIGYIVLVIWSRRQDKRDILKWGVTPLADNFPDDNYFYLLRVYTGTRPGSGTRSRVGFILAGDRMNTGLRELYDGVRNEFSTGSVMNFLLSTPNHLGQLDYLRIWHDNSGGGSSDSWYLNKISIHDIQRKETFEFMVERWLAVEHGELDCTIPLCHAETMNKFKHGFFKNCKDGLSDSHTWISIFYRPQVSSFSRVQRASCALTFLMLSMISNAMYFNPNPNYESTAGIKLGPFRFTLQQLYVSMVSSIITTSVMTVLIILFKKSRRRNKKKASKAKPKSTVSKYYKPPIIDRWLDIQRKKSIELEKHVIVKGYPTFTGFYLPSWVLYIAWFLTILAVLLSAFFIMLYSMQWGKQKSEEWLITFFLSFLESALLIDPFKVLFLSATISIFFSIAKDGDLTLDRETIMRQYRGCVRGTAALKRKPAPLISHTVLLEAKKRREFDLKVKGALIDAAINLFYLWILLSIGYCNRDDRSYMLRKTITDTFLNPENQTPFQEITSMPDYFNWLNITAINALFPEKEYNHANLLWRQKEFISGNSFFRLGVPRLRQVRTTKESCHVPYFGSQPCYLTYELTKEDSSSYCVGWKQKPCPTDEKIKKLSSDAWSFTDPQDIWGLPVTGQYTVYGGGGYIANMAVNREITGWILNELWAESWIDRQTRAVMLEFTLYSADVNLFIYSIFIMETPETGGVTPFYSIQPLRLYMHTGALGMYTLACEVIFLVFVVVNTVLVILKLFQQKRSYFKESWQVIDLLALIGCYAAIVLYFLRFALAMEIIARFNNDRKKFVNFQHIAVSDQTVVLIIALLIFVANIRFLKIVSFSKRVNALVKVFSYNGKDLISFIVIFVIFLMIYAAFGFLLFGSRIDMYSSFHDALSTLFISMIGKTTYTEMNMTDPIMAKIYFILFVVVIVYMVLTIFLSLLEHSISKINEDLAKDGSEDIIDALLKMIKGLVGLSGDTKTNAIKAKEKNLVQPDAEIKSPTPTPSMITITHANDVQLIISDLRRSLVHVDELGIA